MSKETVFVTPFDVNFITKGSPCITLTGHRRSGKSVILKEFMYYLHRAGIPRCCVFSGTEGANKYFASFVPGVFIHSLENISTLETIFNAQKDVFEKKEFGLIPPDTDLRLVLVMDDLAFNEKLMRSRILKEIFFNGRHFEVTLILTMQYITSLFPAMRSNVDVAVLLNEPSIANRKKIYSDFGGGYSTFEKFNDVFTDLTKNYEAYLVTADSTDHNDPDDKVHFYKATMGWQFMFGHQDIIEFNEVHYEAPVDRYLRMQRRQKRNDAAAAEAETEADVTDVHTTVDTVSSNRATVRRKQQKNGVGSSAKTIVVRRR